MDSLDIYCLCPCGSGKKLKFCCYEAYKKGESIPLAPALCKAPIFECKIFEHWQELGISPIFITRTHGSDTYTLGSYIVDFYCLGVKDVFLRAGLTRHEWKNMANTVQAPSPLVDISYQDARSLILGANDYATSLGIRLPLSWNDTAARFVERDIPYDKKFSYGKDGLPFYVMGPYDHENYDIEDIVTKVEKAHGHYLILRPAFESL